jgi:hypothetical protein
MAMELARKQRINRQGAVDQVTIFRAEFLPQLSWVYLLVFTYSFFGTFLKAQQWLG